jgi:uncharacterized membrane protein
MIHNTSKHFKISYRHIAVAGFLLWGIFGLTLFATDFTLLKIVLGFPLLVMYPGLLAFLFFNLRKKFDWYSAGLIVSLGLIVLLVFGLFINVVLPVVNILPLRAMPLFISFTSLFFLFSLGLFRSKKKIRVIKRQVHGWELLLIAISVGLFISFCIGALRLNNGFEGDITLYSLIVMTGLFVTLIITRNRLSEGIICTIIYLNSLALLLMTSLRGWGTVGHDIQREYSVFQLTKDAGFWSSQNLRDAYDACMSISILPTIFSELLTIPDVLVYKILYQIIFALVPVLAFLLFSRYFSRFIALTATLLLISFPTFFTDMPMLNRQEIAFVIFTSLLLVLFDKQIKSKKRNILMILFGFGIILSHYSTTYIVILFLLACWVGFWLVKLILKSQKVRVFFTRHELGTANFVVAKRPVVSLLILTVLILSSYIWSNTFTNTSDSSIKRVLERTLIAVVNDSEGSRSNDTFYSLFTTKKLSSEEIVAEYKSRVVDETRKNAENGTYYDAEAFASYVPTLKPDEVLPLTALGNLLEAYGLNVTEVNKTFKFGTAKLLQLFLIVGLLFSIIRFSNFIIKPKIEYLFLSLAGLVLLVAMVVVPVLSVEYGVLRAFLQILIFAAPFVVIGGLVSFRVFGVTISRVAFTAFVVVFFLSSTGVVTQVLGGYKAAMYLNNSGPYYDFYYMHGTEIAALTWLTKETKVSTVQSEFQTDSYISPTVNEKVRMTTITDVYPSLVRKDAFLMLDHSNIKSNYSTISYEGKLFNIHYPTDLIASNKNKVYDAGDAVIYR